MEFKIGDKIKVIPYEELPEKRKSKGVARACGREGVIIDKLYSSKESRYIYKVQLETFNAPSSIDFTDDMLRFAGGGTTLTLKTTIESDGVAIELYKGDTRLKRSFGRLLYDGEYGIAQAASWAAKLLMRSYEEEE